MSVSCDRGWGGHMVRWERTWYFVSRVLQTPVTSIIATRKGMAVLLDMVVDEDGVRPSRV